MNDAELRSVLARFLEQSIEVDETLTKLLSSYADKLGEKNPMYDYAQFHMRHLSSRYRLMSQVIQQLKSGDQSAGQAFPSEASIPTAAGVAELDGQSGLLESSFEEALVRTYNDEPDRWPRSYRPTSFGAGNVDEIWRTGGEPRFTRKEGGIYHLVEGDGSCYVVPEPGLRLQESYFRSEGLGYLFVCPNLEPGAGALRIWLVRPAIVEELGERWEITRRGEIRGRG